MHKNTIGCSGIIGRFELIFEFNGITVTVCPMRSRCSDVSFARVSHPSLGFIGSHAQQCTVIYFFGGSRTNLDSNTAVYSRMR